MLRMITRSGKRYREENLTRSIWNDLLNYNYKKFSQKDLSIIDGKYDFSKYITPSRIKNYVMGLQDIDIIKRDNLNDTISEGKKYSPKTLINCGINFEKYVYDELRSKFDCEEVDLDYDEYCKIKSDQKFDYVKFLNDKTRRLMLNGTPIILQGVLLDNYTCTWGIADIIIRSDYISSVFDNFIEDDEINTGCDISKPYNKEYHYRIIDIKYSKINLNFDGTNMTDKNEQKFYKHQVCMYTSMLKHIQNYVPNYAYVIGTKYEYVRTINKKKNKYRFDRWNRNIGKINFVNNDKNIINSVLRSIVYRREFDYYPEEFNFDSNPELRPNMKNKSMPEYSMIRKNIAQKYKDLSLVYLLSTKEREKQFDLDVYDYDSIDKVLLNSCAKNFLCGHEYIPDKLDIYDKFESEYFFDYENLNGERVKMLNGIYEPEFNSDHLFMIGLTFESKDNIDIMDIMENLKIKTKFVHYDDKIFMNKKYEFVCFYLEKLIDEKYMIDDMMKFIMKRNELLGIIDYRMFHWSQAEKRINNVVFNRIKTNNRNDIKNKFEQNCQYVDLLKIFKDNKICVRGMSKYGLKNVANAFKKNGYIKTDWEGGKYSDGLVAMLDCEIMYSKGFDQEIIDKVLDYNRIDCDVLFEIVEYMRNKKKMKFI